MSIKSEDLWAAINDYVYTCDGTPDKHVYGNLSRQEAVVKIETILQGLVDATRDDALGNTLIPEDIDHRGVHAARANRSHNLLEKVFAEEWADRNDACLNCPDPHGTLDYLLAEDQQNISMTKSQRDATVAATVIQWLGTEVGQHFLIDVLVSASKKPVGLTTTRLFLDNLFKRLHREDSSIFKNLWSNLGDAVVRMI